MHKVAIIHDNLMAFGGAEVVLETLVQLYPQADVYTVTYNPKAFANSQIAQQHIIPSHINSWVGSRQLYKLFFPVYPAVVEGWDLQGYDLVISSSYNVAHGVITNPYAQHVCYMHTPSRWLWSAYHEYTDTPAVFRSRLIRLLMKVVFHRMRLWDWQAAQRPTIMIANSEEVQKRIQKYYGRTSTVIHPPVEVNQFAPSPDTRKGDYYLTLGRLVPYKHVDLIVRAFRRMPTRQLQIAGDGPDLPRLKRLASGARNISILGPVDHSTKVALLQEAKALMFSPFEDFGITPVEALAAGTPVIGFARGGSLETIIPGVNGVLFEKQEVNSVVAAVDQFESMQFTPEGIIASAQRFAQSEFVRKWKEVVPEG